MSEEYNEGYRKGYIDGLAAKPATGWPAPQPTLTKIDPWIREARRRSILWMRFV